MPFDAHGRGAPPPAPARAAADAPPVICAGCGSTWTDERLQREKAANPALRSCCPERKMVNARVRVHALEAAVRECIEAEEARRKKLKPGAPATTYCDARLARLRSALA